jgi:hypothetical protein
MTITTRAGIVEDMQTPATVLVIEKHPLMRATIVSAIAELLHTLRTMKINLNGSEEKAPHIPGRDTG